MSKRPDEITGEDEYWMGIGRQARDIATKAGYTLITVCAVELYGYDPYHTDLDPAEFVVHKHTLDMADRFFRARMAEAVTERQRDRVVEQWEAATNHSARLVGA